MRKDNQMTDIIVEMNQMLKLSEKNFKVAGIKILSNQLQILWKQMKKKERKKSKISPKT